MEIKTTDEIIEEMKSAWKIVYSRQSTDYPNGVLNNAVDITETNNKKWVVVDDLIKSIIKIKNDRGTHKCQRIIQNLQPTHNKGRK